jgi:hypothetical protein
MFTFSATANVKRQKVVKFKPTKKTFSFFSAEKIETILRNRELGAWSNVTVIKTPTGFFSTFSG